ncbi:hypothetical protein QK290_16315 [Pseudarthrobacter sp. AL07]|uniref:hypothetical protein n=1 Tax=Pseudarthrobacter sp. AL07 TaxID=3042233 RepID=UPI00249AFE15|nr:hypothetical protein [Pseudarthrobacter sp. AL07]MDI3210025.1 hypothetical protein [Pseudarthrobacter sp. AL07]
MSSADSSAAVTGLYGDQRKFCGFQEVAIHHATSKTWPSITARDEFRSDALSTIDGVFDKL